MTGFGRGSATGGTFTVTVEMRSVNNRNLDIHWRAPQELSAWEIPLKKQVQAALSRGRVDVSITLAQTGETNYELNRPLIRGYLAAMRTMRDEFGLAGDADLAAIARLPGVLQTGDDRQYTERCRCAGRRRGADAGIDGVGSDAGG
jgi:uncharacterized protein (TIGR00255 family)